jgi:hypothetical protein
MKLIDFLTKKQQIANLIAERDAQTALVTEHWVHSKNMTREI